MSLTLGHLAVYPSASHAPRKKQENYYPHSTDKLVLDDKEFYISIVNNQQSGRGSKDKGSPKAARCPDLAPDLRESRDRE